MTQFTYYEANIGSDYNFWRLYASPIMYTIVLTHMYLLATLFMGLVFCWSQKKKAHPFTTTPVQDLKNIDFSASKEDLKPNKDSSNAIEDDLATKWELTPNN